MGMHEENGDPEGGGDRVEKVYTGATCRGCYALGTACGKCEKCSDERRRIAFQRQIDAEKKAAVGEPHVKVGAVVQENLRSAALYIFNNSDALTPNTVDLLAKVVQQRRPETMMFKYRPENRHKTFRESFEIVLNNLGELNISDLTKLRDAVLEEFRSGLQEVYEGETELDLKASELAEMWEHEHGRQVDRANRATSEVYHRIHREIGDMAARMFERCSNFGKGAPGENYATPKSPDLETVSLGEAPKDLSGR